jgi:hypothetical protein
MRASTITVRSVGTRSQNFRIRARAAYLGRHASVGTDVRCVTRRVEQVIFLCMSREDCVVSLPQSRTSRAVRSRNCRIRARDAYLGYMPVKGRADLFARGRNADLFCARVAKDRDIYHSRQHNAGNGK